MRERVLVTDGDQRAALACVRALGRAGFTCYVTGPGKQNLAGASRYAAAAHDAPDPLREPEAFLEAMLDLARKWQVDFLLPITEKSLRAVLPHTHRFDAARIPFPDAGTFFRVSDKAEVLSTALALGIDVPSQWECRSAEELHSTQLPEGAFPLVIKPARSVSGVGGAARQIGVRYARAHDDLHQWCERATPEHFPVLLQQRVVGYGAGVFVLVWEGDLKAVAGHRRIREKPPSGGVSVVRESTEVEPTLLDRSLHLLRELGWKDGVAMVEYKVDGLTGVPHLMEINGRFWGSLQLAIDAGVDFPTLLLECASGRPPANLVVGLPGVRTRWLLGDLDQLLLRLLRGRERLNLPPGYPGRWRAVLEFLSDFRPGVRSEVFRLGDPRPTLAEAATWLSKLIRG